MSSGDVKPGDGSDADKKDASESDTGKGTGSGTIDAKHKSDVATDNNKTPPAMTTTSEPARLCYVDDSRTSAYVVKRMLRPFGYTVDHYDSAEPALIALVQGTYDLLLTDLKVSQKGMDGDDLVRALRNSGHANISSLPIIVITGSTDTSILADVYEAGANQIMTKPVNGDELNEHIRKLVYSNQVDSANVGTTQQSGTRHRKDSAASHPKENESHEEIVLETSTEGEANFLGPDTFQKKPANVVFFDSEAKQTKANDIDLALQDVDSIPVLNPSDEFNGLTPQSEPSSVDSPAPDSAPMDNADGDRRVLAHGPVVESDVVVPRPTNYSAPAAKVKPTITVKPSSDSNNDRMVKSSISNAAARREAALRAQAAVAAAQKSKRIMAAKAKKKAQAAAALKKLKEAAALKAMADKKAQQINKQRIIAAAKAKAAAAAEAEKKKQQEQAFTADNLTLEPKDGVTFTPGQSHTSVPPVATPAHEPVVSPKADVPPPVQATASAAPQANANSASVSPPADGTMPQSGHELSTTSKPIQLVHPRDGGTIESAGTGQASSFVPPQQPQQPQQPPPRRNTGFGDVGGPPPQVSKDEEYANSILTGMDQFPLVEADMHDQYAPSRVLSVFGSLFELYGLKKIAVMALAILAVFFTYDWWGTLLNLNSGTPVDLSIVEQGEIYQSITVPGKVVSKLRVNITPSIAGRLTKVLVDEGDTVKDGQLLARLDDREATSYLKKAKASHNSAKEDVELARRTLKRLQQAFKKGAVPRQLVEDAEVDLRSATARESITAEEVRTAKVSLENPRILAPFSGVVTARFVEVGQWVVPSETLFTLIDPKQREVEVKVDAADSGGIAVGQTVSLSSDAFPGLEWSESVARLAAATTNVGNANTVSVYISLGSNSPSLRFGQQVDADIRTAWNPNAVKVPFGAIINRNGKSWVAVLEGDRARLVEVTTGIEDFSHVEITNGVTIGETIILANGKRLREGERVYLSTTK